MNISHILYKVDNLDEGKKFFENHGFTVEYGSKENPHNAIVHFPDGSYIEIIQNMGFTKLLSWFLRRMGYGEFVDGMLRQENEPEGYIRIAFENDDATFKFEKNKFGDLGLKTVVAPVKRKDFEGNILKCKCLFPYKENYPFIKSRFENNGIRNVKHSNGVIGIEKIDYYTTVEVVELINRLGGCEQLNLIIGEKPMVVNFLYENN